MHAYDFSFGTIDAIYTVRSLKSPGMTYVKVSLHLPEIHHSSCPLSPLQFAEKRVN